MSGEGPERDLSRTAAAQEGDHSQRLRSPGPHESVVGCVHADGEGVLWWVLLEWARPCAKRGPVLAGRSV